jgi:hypothetical protein
MSFNIPRDSNNKLIKTSVTTNSSPALDSTISIGTTGLTTFASLTSLSLNGTTITATAAQINSVNSTIGTATPNKALIVDNTISSTGLNNISCNSLQVNGTNITSNLFSSATSNDAANAYLTNITPGTALPSKSLILDGNNSIKNINNLSTQSLNINNTSVTNNTGKNINLNNLYNSRLLTNINMNSPQSYINGSPLTIMSLNSADNTYIQNAYWTSVCWSPQLSLYVAVCAGSTSSITLTSYRVMTSSNGYTWTLQNTPSSTDYKSVCWSPELNLFVAVGSNIITSSNGIDWTVITTPPNQLSSICWASELRLFVAVSSYGTNNKVMTSTNGINWILRNTPGDSILQSICWSPELNLFVVVGNSSPTNGERVLMSSDGINWSLSNSGYNYTWISICWSSEKMMFVAVSNSLPGFMISKDGYLWTLNSDFLSNSMNPSCICWAKDIELFLAVDHNNNNCNLLYSYNGYNWNKGTQLKNGGNSYGCIIWNSEYKQFITVSNYSSYNGAEARVAISSPITTSSNNSGKGNSIIFSKTNNCIGINSTALNKLLEIDNINGNCFKQYCNIDNSKFITYDVLNTGQLNITNQKYFNIPTDNSTYGLLLNNTLITTTPTEFNTYLKNNTLGSASSNKPLFTDSSINISGINIFSCNSLIVNGTALSTVSTNSYFTNAIPGTATASSAIMPSTNNSITSLNNISTQKININNSDINISSTNEINLTTIQDKTYYQRANIKNALNKLTVRSTTTGQYFCCTWSPELGIFIAGSYTGTNRMAYSTNGVNWIDIVNPIVNTFVINAICWSPELFMFVALTNNGYILVSKNGFDWNISFNQPDASAIFQGICWSPELNLFVAVASAGTNRIMISNNGYKWSSAVAPTANSWKCVCWADKLNLFVACSVTTTVSTNLIYSSDGIIWNTATAPFTNSIFSIDWSSELNIFVAVCGSIVPFLYSYDGKNWASTMQITGNNQTVKWISELSCFISTTFNNPMYISYSFDGVNWSTITTALNYNCTSIVWSSELSMIIFASYSGTVTTNIITTDIIGVSYKSNIKSQSNEFVFDNINGKVGLGITPTYQLQLSSDSAAKPATSTWTVSSDQRLKDNIQDADLNLCYNNIKNLRLAKYTWKDEVYTSEQVADRSKLGWIAQEVEQIFPKAVEKQNMHGYEDCRTLNTDQIIASMYGCAKQIINNYNDDENKFVLINNKIQQIETFLNSLPDE